MGKLTNQGSFIDTVGNVGTRETWSQSRESALEELNILLGNDLLQVNTEDLASSVHGRLVDVNMPVEASGTHQSIVENVRSVSTSKNDNLLGGVETVHFGQDLVERGLSLVVAAAKVLL
jgi:hypothetical protein